METPTEELLTDRIRRAVEVCETYRQTWVAKLIHAVLDPCPGCGAWDGCPGCVVPPEETTYEQERADQLGGALLTAHLEIDKLRREAILRKAEALRDGMRFLPAVMSELPGWHQELTTREQQLMDAAMVVHMRRVGQLSLPQDVCRCGHQRKDHSGCTGERIVSAPPELPRDQPCACEQFVFWHSEEG
jgi:hypothetical protein